MQQAKTRKKVETRKEKTRKKGTKRVTKLTPIAGVIMLGFVLYFVINTGLNVYERQLAVSQLEAKRDELAAQKENLSDEVSLLADEDYVAQYARDHYIFSKDGEVVIKLPDVKK